MTVAVERIIEEAKRLSAEERHDLEEALRELDKPTAEEDVMLRLAAEGIVTIPVRPLSSAKPVPVSGKPVSEILIEERR